MAQLSWNEITDRAADKLYQKETFATDVERVAMLFEKYRSIILKEGSV